MLLTLYNGCRYVPIGYVYVACHIILVFSLVARYSIDVLLYATSLLCGTSFLLYLMICMTRRSIFTVLHRRCKKFVLCKSDFKCFWTLSYSHPIQNVQYSKLLGNPKLYPKNIWNNITVHFIRNALVSGSYCAQVLSSYLSTRVRKKTSWSGWIVSSWFITDNYFTVIIFWCCGWHV